MVKIGGGEPVEEVGQSLGFIKKRRNVMVVGILSESGVILLKTKL